MFNWYDIRKQLRAYAAPVACLCAIGYFAYHTLQGHRSLITYVHLENELAAAQVELAAAAQRRLRLERRVALLRPENIDRDILDEQARKVLGLGHADEVVIFHDKARK